MCSSGSFLSLIARGELGKITMVITFPVSLGNEKISLPPRNKRGEPARSKEYKEAYILW